MNIHSPNVTIDDLDQELADNPDRLEEVSFNGWTPLIAACNYGNMEIARSVMSNSIEKIKEAKTETAEKIEKLEAQASRMQDLKGLIASKNAELEAAVTRVDELEKALGVPPQRRRAQKLWILQRWSAAEFAPQDLVSLPRKLE
jgi:ankyrin repeat protein